MDDSDFEKAAGIQRDLCNSNNMQELEEFYKTIEKDPQHSDRVNKMNVLFGLLKKR